MSRHAADGRFLPGSRPAVPFAIPADSPLATGWRAVAVGLLEKHGLQDVLDLISAYAELRCRAEPDNCTAEEEAAQSGWFTWRAAAQRRIEAVDIPRGPGRPRLDSDVDESLETPRRKVAS